MENLHMLSKYKGFGTSILNLIIPPGTSVAQIVSHLQAELSTASNIKCSKNRKSVQDAIKSATIFFKNWKQIPDTGMAVYSGWYV